VLLVSDSDIYLEVQEKAHSFYQYLEGYRRRLNPLRDVHHYIFITRNMCDLDRSLNSENSLNSHPFLCHENFGLIHRLWFVEPYVGSKRMKWVAVSEASGSTEKQ
jgi:hypothetical protein